MSLYLWQQGEYVLRLILAGLCGAAVGYERNNRLKGAGVRTHLIVALAASLMMIISKYGFFDVIGDHVQLDPSRIGAGIVTAVGFLGAGIIYVRRSGQGVTGVTTSAGLWATVGVGMAMGSGMYLVGAAATLLLLAAQLLLHRNLHFLKVPVGEQLVIEIKNSNAGIEMIEKRLAEHRIQVVNIRAEKLEDGIIRLDIFAKFPEHHDPARLVELFKDDPDIRSIDI